MTAFGGLLNTYAASEYQKAQGINQQTSYMLQARESLFIANIRADMATQYAEIQAGRIVEKAKAEEMNWKIAGNTLLNRMRETNAAIRARAAASGVVVGEGSNQGVTQRNVDKTMFDVAVTDLNALTARVMGFEDATALIQSTQYQNMLNKYTAASQASQYDMAGSTARSSSGLLADINLAKGVYEASKVLK